MIFSLFDYLDSVNCNHREYVQLWQLFDKDAITFDQKEIERKKLYLVGMKFRCASNAAIKKCQNRKKKNQLFSQNIFNKSPFFFKKIQIFRKYKVYFQILEILPVILTTYLPV